MAKRDTEPYRPHDTDRSQQLNYDPLIWQDPEMKWRYHLSIYDNRYLGPNTRNALLESAKLQLERDVPTGVLDRRMLP